MSVNVHNKSATEEGVRYILYRVKKALIAFVLLVLIFTLTGCGNKITEGEVYQKAFKEAYTQTTFLPLTISNGKTTTTMMVPYFIRYPDRYVIHIKAFNDGEWCKEDFYVSQSVYEGINIGDMFLYDEKRGDLCEEPYTKERKED